MQRVSIVSTKAEDETPRVFRDEIARGRALRLHDQMLATMAWVIEEATVLDPDAPSLEPLYEAFDFLAVLRERTAVGED